MQLGEIDPIRGWTAVSSLSPFRSFGRRQHGNGYRVHRCWLHSHTEHRPPHAAHTRVELKLNMPSGPVSGPNRRIGGYKRTRQDIRLFRRLPSCIVCAENSTHLLHRSPSISLSLCFLDSRSKYAYTYTHLSCLTAARLHTAVALSAS